MFVVLCVQYQNEKAGAVRSLVLLEMYKPSVICRGRLAADTVQRNIAERESRCEGEEVVIRRKKHGDTVFPSI